MKLCRIKNHLPLPQNQVKEKRNWLTGLRSILFLLLLGVGYYCYQHWNDFLAYLDPKPISNFALIGQSQFTTVEDIQNNLAQYGELNGYFSQDMETVKNHLEGISWIKAVVVKKLWPDKLSILVLEHQPIATWNDNAYLSNEGVVFKLPFGRVNNDYLPHLAGPDFQGLAVLSAFQKIVKSLQLKGLTLDRVSVDERGSWNIKLKNQLMIKLGRGEWKEKMDRFLTIYPQIDVPENKRLVYIDLRYKSGAAVGFEEIK